MIQCDRCGKQEASGKEGDIVVGVIRFMGQSYDICGSCRHNFLEWIMTDFFADSVKRKLKEDRLNEFL